MKNKKTPMRRCIGCMESKDKNKIIRVAWYDGKLTVDPTGKAKGRGVYLCRNGECMEKAKKKNAIARSLGAEISKDEMDRIFRELKSYEE
ncbi:MAG: YlxR family protein [Eubacteriales bacterium]|nr:YlxR family protein [Eubacteriales bacterium]